VKELYEKDGESGKRKKGQKLVRGLDGPPFFCVKPPKLSVIIEDLRKRSWTRSIRLVTLAGL
jgi:hypothetical protein